MSGARRALRAVGIAAGYFVLAKIGLLFFSQEEKLALVWPPSGFFLAVLLLLPRREWPAPVAAVFASIFLVSLAQGLPPPVSAGFAAANCFETFLAASIFVAFVGRPAGSAGGTAGGTASGAEGAAVDLGSPRHVAALVLGAGVVGCAVAALAGAAVPALGMGAPYWSVWRHWWVADCLGIIAVAPIVVAFASPSSSAPCPTRPSERAAAFALLFLSVGVAFDVFAPAAIEKINYPFILLPAVVWIGVRLGGRAAALTVLFVAACGVAGTVAGRGAFASGSSDLDANLLAIQVFSGVAGAIVLGAHAASETLRRSEAALGKSRALLQSVVDGSPSLIYATDMEGRFILFNRAIGRVFGVEPDAAIGRTRAEALGHLIPPDLAEEHRRNDLKVAESGREVEFEEGGIEADGPHIYRSMKHPLRDPAGRIVGVAGISRDITDDVRNENKLRDVANEMAAIYDSVGVALLLVDSDWRVRKANAAAMRFGGRESGEGMDLRGGEWLRCLHSLDDPGGCGAGPSCAGCKIRLAVISTLSTGEAHGNVEETLPFPVGGQAEKRCLLVSTARVRIGDAFFATVAAQDITGVKRAEEALRRTEARLVQAGRLSALGRLSAAIAHEMNQPLSAVKSYCQALLIPLERGSAPPEARLRENLGRAMEQVDRMAEIIRNIRVFSAKKDDASFGRVSLREVVGYPERLLGAQLRAQGVSLETVLPDEEIEIMGAENRLHQVLVNLVVNARDAVLAARRTVADRPGRIRVAVSRAGSTVEIRVEDDGVGIPPEEVERVFEPFFSSKDGDETSGLGLWICHEIVAAHGGEIRVESEPGVRTVFTVTLPIPLPPPPPDTRLGARE